MQGKGFSVLAQRSRLEASRLPHVICNLVLFCTAAAIALPAQSVFFTTLANFEYTNGAQPSAGLVQATDGNLYGTAGSGGTFGAGTVFKITPSGTLTTLYSFCPQCIDGDGPDSGLVQGRDGNFYGTTEAGGANGNYGTVFKITPEGDLTTLHSFNGSDGAFPGVLIQATDGNFYGTTTNGGFGDNGTVFEITPSGVLTTLHHFNGVTDGLGPSDLMQATDGNFYGSSTQSRMGGVGIIFKLTAGGLLSRLYNYCRQPNCTDGDNPNQLIQANDGNFYGTTVNGGEGEHCYGFGCGTVFKITPSGTLTTLYSFCHQANCADGGSPVGTLVQASDGNLYGTTSTAAGVGLVGYGTVFKITPSGTLTTLHAFDLTDGSDPTAGLVQATNGNFYGTTCFGGDLDLEACAYDGCGTVFRLGVVHTCATCRP